MLSYFASEFVSVTLRQYAAGAFTAGVWTAGVYTETAIVCVMPQPIKAQELNSIGYEGESFSDFRKTWVSSSVAASVRAGDIDCDEVVWDGNTYKVVSVDTRSLDSFHRIVMRRKGGA